MLLIGVQRFEGGYRWFAESGNGAQFHQPRKKKRWPRTRGGAKRSFRYFIRKFPCEWAYADNADGINVQQTDMFSEKA